MCLCDAAGLHVFPTFVLYELTILLVLTLTLVIMKVRHFSLFLLLSSPSPCSQSSSLSSLLLPVRDGRPGAVGHLASRLSTHTVDCLSRSRSGQRILLRPGKPCASCWHHLQRGQWWLNMWFYSSDRKRLRWLKVSHFYIHCWNLFWSSKCLFHLLLLLLISNLLNK